jgi:hypothetical protein
VGAGVIERRSDACHPALQRNLKRRRWMASRGTRASDCPFSTVETEELGMGKGKMSGDNSSDSKRGEARGSGGTTKKSQDAGKQHNTKANNTKSNKQ